MAGTGRILDLFARANRSGAGSGGSDRDRMRHYEIKIERMRTIREEEGDQITDADHDKDDLPEVHQLTLMDELEQKCYDLDAKVRRVEEERDAVMNENEELHDQVNHLRHAVDTAHQSLDVGALSDPAGEELIRISEEVTRLDGTLSALRDQFLTVNDKVKEVSTLKDSVRTVMEETACVKEDFLNLKNHLNLAAKIELQTNEKMYENRLHHLEKMLEEMRHREESFLHIAEETNILKDQVDSLRELSLTSMRSCESNHLHGASLDPSLRMLQQHPHQDHPSLGEELMVGAEAPSAECRPTSLQLSYDSPVTEQPASADGASPTDRANSSRRSSRGNSPVKVTGQVKLNLSTPKLAPSSSSSEAPRPSAAAQMTQTEAVVTADKRVSVSSVKLGLKKKEVRMEEEERESEPNFSCCSNLFAMTWAHLFD